MPNIGRTQSGNLQVATPLYDFINNDVLPGTGIEPDKFWHGFEEIIAEFAPRDRRLLAKRDQFQNQIDQWHTDNPDGLLDMDAYKDFLNEIGYLVPEGDKFSIDTVNVDPEIATTAGPQLVVPIMNARYALNAANARWGSLYDALYGTNAISDDNGAEKSSGYNPERGKKVVAWARDFLDMSAPIADGSWKDIERISIADGALTLSTMGKNHALETPPQFVGFTGNSDNPASVLLVKNGMHLEIIIDKTNVIGKTDQAGIADIILESALTTIMDCEDSVAAVDAEDKVVIYQNWLGLMNGRLEEEVQKAGKTITRKLNPDRIYAAPNGKEIALPGRAIMLVRNVGLLMSNSAILDRDGIEVPETLLDGVINPAIALHDVGANGRRANSRSGSIYTVNPKMHGPEEVAFINDLFGQAEALLSLPANTIKMGIMDEERRTTINLKECIRAAKNRVFFINTGFLDRTGDEMHTSMLAGPMIRKGDMKTANWITAYENWNVDIGLECGLSGKAQIGKGMWAMPDLMAEMLEQKIGHPMSGANTAWVPSPTAATLHATHYHSMNVAEQQAGLMVRGRANIDDILSIPITTRPNWSAEDIQAELDNNAQGILGYVIRWVEDGIGCSKVPDINNVGLMEDRATLRISSQHMANWLHHGIVDKSQIVATMEKMAAIVDQQNSDDPTYKPMAGNFDNSIAFQAAVELVLNGREQPSGYTEPILHRRRIEAKARAQSQCSTKNPPFQ